MCDIYRIIECHAGVFQEIAFVAGFENAKDYLKTCYSLTQNEPDRFYFAIKIKVEL